MKNLEKLISIGSDAICSGPPAGDESVLRVFGHLGDELLNLLRLRNGFYAFESALHLFPCGPAENDIPLITWNSSELWRNEYGSLADAMLFFGEDAFGNQFCIRGNRICTFEAETGNVEVIAKSFEQWGKEILDDFRVLTGHPLMHEWQTQHGALPVGKRLMPRTPFVLGGEYKVENLYALSSVSAMKTRGNLAVQIKDLPDGAQIEFRVIE